LFTICFELNVTILSNYIIQTNDIFNIDSIFVMIWYNLDEILGFVQSR